MDEISTESGFKLYLAPEYNFENNATVTGTVASLPQNYKGNLEVGNEVAFSYHVVSSRDFPNTADFFVPISEGNPHLKIWMNKKGEKLRMWGRPGAISYVYTGSYFNNHGQFQYGTQGTEREVERWIATNFKFGDCEKFAYKNLIQLGTEKYWKCNLDHVFAKKVNGEIVAVGNRVICEIIDIPIPQQIKEIKGIKLPDKSVVARLYDRGVVVSGGESLGLKKGDCVSFNEQYCEKYTLWNKDFFLIKERRIEGVWIKDKAA